MYTRLIILSVVIVIAVCGLGGLGYHAIEKWSEGLEGARLGEFAEVAEQVRQDVKRKLDEFIRAEQQREYTEYRYYYVPANVVDAQQMPLLRSPLGNELSNSFAYGYFQVEPDGSVVTPYYPGEPAPPVEQDELAREAQRYVTNLRRNIIPSVGSGSDTLVAGQIDREAEVESRPVPPATAKTRAGSPTPAAVEMSEAKSSRSKAYPIESLKEAQEAQTFTQQRSLMESNFQQAAPSQQTELSVIEPLSQSRTRRAQQPASAPLDRRGVAGNAAVAGGQPNAVADSMQTQADQYEGAPTLPSQSISPQDGSSPSEMVQIRVEPFIALVVPGQEPSIFGGQVFLLRHVQIEDRRLLQGFQLDEQKLITEVEESAKRFMRDGMTFELPQARPTPQPAGDTKGEPAYTAILDFGFGDLALNLTEIDPAWIPKRIGELHFIYFGIIATVAVAVSLALASLWHNVRTQMALVRKKDDFISAVSHELRTPLTSIRMYAEMLEKNWVKSTDKLAEYYRTMRQESERLSRLVENVLDFARLQKGRKRYAFELGSINDCVGKVVEMMRPYAEQQGFTVLTNLGKVEQTSFDKDAVTQIVVNLIDNAVKYAHGAADKMITVGTRTEAAFTIIEVEDHGPGIPHRQRRKVFDQFYRCDDAPVEGPSQNSSAATGTGLGLTLVKRFAEAHGGYVEIGSVEPTGVVLRVGLATPPTGS